MADNGVLDDGSYVERSFEVGVYGWVLYVYFVCFFVVIPLFWGAFFEFLGI